jgi:G:T-mismatch repair DNA endonuclease (very short patch repair protein)
MKENNETTVKRIRELREILKVDIKWECELNRELKENKIMKEFFSDLGNDKGPINPRDAYYGGRTGYYIYYSIK